AFRRLALRQETSRGGNSSQEPGLLGTTQMAKQLWAPWRLEYIQQADELEGCVFCLAAAGDDEHGLVVRRGTHGFALLNKFPYASGHLMVAPYRHLGEFGALSDEEALELHRLAESGMAALAETFGP